MLQGNHFGFRQDRLMQGYGSNESMGGRMYGNYNYRQDGVAVKWIVCSVLAAVAGAVLLGVYASNNYSPTTAAQARRIDAETNAYQIQTQQQQDKSKIDLDTYQRLQDAEVAYSQAQHANALIFQVQQYQQQSNQSERDFQKTAMLKDFAVQGGVGGLVAVMIILSLSAGVVWSARAWTAAMLARSQDLLARAQLESAHEDVRLKALGEINAMLQALHTESSTTREILAKAMAELMETKVLLAGLQERRNGQSSKEDEPVGEANASLRLVK